MGVSRAQNKGLTSEQVEREIQRLERLLELQQKVREHDARHNPPQSTNQHGNMGQPVGRWYNGENSPANQKNQGRTTVPQVPQSPTTLRPIDTGSDVASFAIGGKSLEAPGRVVIKNNLFYDLLTMTPNIGVDVGLGRRTSIGLLAGYNNWHNLWEFSEKGPEYDKTNDYLRKMDHVYTRVEFRYWFRQRFTGHSAGAYAFAAQYKVGEMKVPPLLPDKKSEYDGNTYGGGFSYGYLWSWSKHWGMEFTLGAGFLVTRYDKKKIDFDAKTIPGYALGTATRHRKVYVGPTSLGINIVVKL
jgi:hypothetical protein